MSAMSVDGPRPAVEWVTSLPHRLTDAEFRVLMLLALDSFDGQRAAPGYDNLARWSGLLRSSVGAAIARLCEPTDDRPALIRRDGRRNRLTVFALNRPVVTDTWSTHMSGHGGQHDPSAPNGHDDLDTPGHPSGVAGPTPPISGRGLTAASGFGKSTAPRHLHVYVDPEDRHVLVRLDGDASQWLRDHNLPAFRSRPKRGYFMRPERVADLLAVAQREGLTVRIHRRSPTHAQSAAR